MIDAAKIEELRGALADRAHECLSKHHGISNEARRARSELEGR